MTSRTSGRHSKRPKMPARVPVQGAVRAFGMIDPHTRVEHLVLEESAAAHRRAGRYLARCGIEVMAASLTEPGRARCAECAR